MPDRAELSRAIGCAIVFLTLAITNGCRERHEITVTFLRSETYTFSPSERHAIETIANKTVAEVRPLLPALPPDLTLTVRVGTDVIDEIGSTAAAMPPKYIMWTVDPSRYGGVTKIARAQLRRTLFHDLLHLVRDEAVPMRSLQDRIISEGLATVFERDGAHVDVPWATIQTMWRGGGQR